MTLVTAVITVREEDRVISTVLVTAVITVREEDRELFA